jgi:hypothetical protein
MITSKNMRWVGQVARLGEKKNAHMLTVGKPERKRLLGSSTRTWTYNIKTDLREMGKGISHLIDLARVGKKKKKKTPWSESASELYRPSDRRFSAKCCQLVRIEGATWSA